MLKHGDVLLRRREGETLRLSRESNDAAQRDALLTAVRLLTLGAGAQGQIELVGAKVAQRLPWTRFLSDSDRTAFVEEFLRTLEACADLGEFAALGRLVGDWKATASLHAEGLGPRLKRPIRERGGKVPRP
ncbi:MAG: hypothetical protein M3R46_13430 [Actinomycetota bacterium]|nr:hypothetical protein [Actinomycetota bacterium]